MRTLLKEVEGIDWGDAAVMNCKWKGPRLKDVLDAAGVSVANIKEGHVAFASFQTECQDDSWYGGSITLARAIDPNADVILALEVGVTLPSQRSQRQREYLSHNVEKRRNSFP